MSLRNQVVRMSLTRGGDLYLDVDLAVLLPAMLASNMTFIESCQRSHGLSAFEFDLCV